MDFFTTHISQNASKYINDILKTTFISAGKFAEKFENELTLKLGICNPVTVNSGTSALHLALAVAGVKAGDEVITPPQTFIATGTAVLMQGAKVVFADIQCGTGNIDPNSIKEKITENTKAIIPVHWAGYPCDLDEINKIAAEYKLTVIEDAAHALGAIYKNKPIGTISRFTAFSFQAIKHLTTGDGGGLCCLNENDFKNAKRRRWFGIDRENSTPDILGERIYNADSLGFKYHLNDFAAALGLANLEDIKEILNRHIYIGNYYRTNLTKVPGLQLLNYLDDRQSSYWLFTVLVEQRENFIRALKSRNIPSSVVHLRIDKNSIFGGVDYSLNNQNIFDSKQVSIPINASLSDQDIFSVVEAINKGW